MISWNHFPPKQTHPKLGIWVSLNISLFFISGKGRRSPGCFLLLFLTTFFFSFNSEIYEKKKKKKEAHLTTASNWRLTKYRIDNNKLEDWNDKRKS